MKLYSLLCIGLILAAPAGAETLTVGSKPFTESRLLAEIMAQHLERTLDVSVVRKPNLGGTVIAYGALERGDIDLYAEYTGTGWSVLLKRTDAAGDALSTYTTVARDMAHGGVVAWGLPFGFENGYAIAVRRPVAERLNLKTLSDVADRGQDLRAAFSHEFVKRPDGLTGLAERYGIDWEHQRAMEHGLAYRAVADGAADLVDTYTTDGKLVSLPVVLLEDDRGLFPPYDAAPLLRQDALVRVPGLGPALSELAGRLDAATMQTLNHTVEARGGDVAGVAADFLKRTSPRLAEAAGADAHAPGADSVGPTAVATTYATVWSAERGQIVRAAATHLWLCLVALLLAVLVALPTGILLAHRRALAPVVLAGTGVIQTIPGLALLALLIPLPGFGLGATSAIFALFVYALLPIVQNTYSGIVSVDPRVVDAARGLGLTDGQVLRDIELPLAARSIMAGIRTAAVIAVGVATIAAFVGAGGLGDLILTGLQLNHPPLILAGALPAAALALAVDGGLAILQRRLSPKL